MKNDGTKSSTNNSNTKKGVIVAIIAIIIALALTYALTDTGVSMMVEGDNIDETSPAPPYFVVLDVNGKTLDIIKYELPEDYELPKGARVVEAFAERRLIDWHGDGTVWIYVDEVMAPIDDLPE